MKFDPFNIVTDLEGVEFLGFCFHKHKLGWIPCYNEGRLLASFCYTIEKVIDPAAMLMKAWTLTVMAAGGDPEVFDLMAASVNVYMLNLADSVDPTVLAFLQVGPPEYDACISFFLGLEGGEDIGVLFDVATESSFRLEDGWF